MYSQSCTLKFKKREGIYRGSNVSFDPNKIQAFSYSWWCFVAKIDGKVVFNNYTYSPSTTRHQYKVRQLMAELGIKIDILMPISKGLPGSYRRSYASDDTVPESSSLESLIVLAEEELCDKFWCDILKRQDRYQRIKSKKLAAKAEELALQDAEHMDEVKNKILAASPLQFGGLKLVK